MKKYKVKDVLQMLKKDGWFWQGQKVTIDSLSTLSNLELLQ